VGKSLVTQAVLKPLLARPKAALRPAPPAPTTTASYWWSMMGYLMPTYTHTQTRVAVTSRGIMLM